MTRIAKLAGFAAVLAALYGTTSFTRDRASPSWSAGARQAVATAPLEAPGRTSGLAAVVSNEITPALRTAQPVEPVKATSLRDADSTGSLQSATEPVAQAASVAEPVAERPAARRERPRTVKRDQAPRRPAATEALASAPAYETRPARIHEPIQFRLAERG